MASATTMTPPRSRKANFPFQKPKVDEEWLPIVIYLHVCFLVPHAAQREGRGVQLLRGVTCVPPDNARARFASWWTCRCRRRRALCADREARCTRRFALLPSARVRRGGLRHHHARACRGTLACYFTAACAVRVGAARHCNRSALPPGQADPPHFERARGCTPLERGIMTRHDDLNVAS